jgi:hypothetical protein
MPSFSDIVIGSVKWVNNAAAFSADTPSNGSYAKPYDTIDYAIGQCAAGDRIAVAATHAETVTAAITMDVAGVSIFGERRGNYMPVITPNGVINALTMTAAGCYIQSLEFAAPLTDAQTADINIAAAKCSVVATRHLGSVATENKVDIFTIQAAATSFLLDGVRIYNTVVEVPSGIKIVGAVARGEICNCYVWDSVGFTNGALYDAAAATGLYVHHNVFSNAKANTVVLNFVANSTGVCSFNHINGRHTTIASNVVTGTSMNFFENRVVEEPTLNGAIIPAADTE